MTELERVLLDRLERIETAHQQQTTALEQQLQQQARSLSELQIACTSAGELRGVMRRATAFVRDVAERGRAVEQSDNDSAWQLKQQCQRLERGAGRLAEGAALIADRAAELRKEQRRDRGFSM